MADKQLLASMDQTPISEKPQNVNIEIFPSSNDKAVLSVQTGDKRQFLLYRRIAQYNKDLTKTNTEEVSVSVNKQMIVGTITAFSGQTGIVFVWDLLKNRIIHVSNGAYAVRSILFNNKVYSLHFVSSWGKKPEFQLHSMDFGTKDPNKAPSIIFIPEAASKHSWSNNIELNVINNRLTLEIDEDSYTLN